MEAISSLLLNKNKSMQIRFQSFETKFHQQRYGFTENPKEKINWTVRRICKSNSTDWDETFINSSMVYLKNPKGIWFKNFDHSCRMSKDLLSHPQFTVCMQPIPIYTSEQTALAITHILAPKSSFVLQALLCRELLEPEFSPTIIELCIHDKLLNKNFHLRT